MTAQAEVLLAIGLMEQLAIKHQIPIICSAYMDNALVTNYVGPPSIVRQMARDIAAALQQHEGKEAPPAWTPSNN